MNKDSGIAHDLASIRDMMERSTKFISLSGLTGVIAGSFALVGSFVAYLLIYYPNTPFGFRTSYANERLTLIYLCITALAVLGGSLLAGALLTVRKARKSGQAYWDKNAKRMIINLALPLIAGGIFILILVFRGHFDIVAPAFLLFYGMSLVNASSFTLTDIRYLGICEMILGLLCALLPGYGLLFWATGFGVLHIIYGLLLYNKYDK